MKPETTNQCERALLDEVEVREIDEDARKATFVAATENGVDTALGREYLRMPGIKLQRYRKNPVVLDAHNRWTAGAVIGKAAVKVKGRELMAEITFATTRRADEVWQLVVGGFLKALSVGFIPDRSKVLDLGEGETDGEGATLIQGPARVVKSWVLFELSVVPVPADADALRRSFLHGDDAGLLSAMHSLVNGLQRLEAGVKREKETDMAEQNEQGKEEARAAEAPAKTTPQAPVGTQEEETTRAIEATARQIRAIAPRGMETFADGLVTEGVDVPTARARIREELAKRSQPAGTQEPEQPTKDDKPKLQVKDVSDSAFARALCG